MDEKRKEAMTRGFQVAKAERQERMSMKLDERCHVSSAPFLGCPCCPFSTKDICENGEMEKDTCRPALASHASSGPPFALCCRVQPLLLVTAAIDHG